VNRLRSTPAKSEGRHSAHGWNEQYGQNFTARGGRSGQGAGVKNLYHRSRRTGKAPIPVQDEAGNTRVIMAKVDVDERTLQAIAAQTVVNSIGPRTRIRCRRFMSKFNGLEKSAQTVQKFEHYEELYRWALVPALASWVWARYCSAFAEAALRFSHLPG